MACISERISLNNASLLVMTVVVAILVIRQQCERGVIMAEIINCLLCHIEEADCTDKDPRATGLTDSK